MDNFIKYIIEFLVRAKYTSSASSSICRSCNGASFNYSFRFLITRYEEYVNKEDRDQYGRLLGRKSLPYRSGFLMRPIVDEYGKLLRGWLRETGFSVEEPLDEYGHIYLAHDVDEI